MAVNQGKRPSLRVQASSQHSAISSQPNKTKKKVSRRRKRKFEPKLPISVVMREGKTTIRQLDGRRFVRFGEARGKRVACVEFYTCGPNMHEISVRFQDKTVFRFEITPLFTVKPEYYSLKTGDVEMIKAWPEMKIER